MAGPEPAGEPGGGAGGLGHHLLAVARTSARERPQAGTGTQHALAGKRPAGRLGGLFCLGCAEPGVFSLAHRAPDLRPARNGPHRAAHLGGCTAPGRPQERAGTARKIAGRTPALERAVPHRAPLRPAAALDSGVGRVRRPSDAGRQCLVDRNRAGHYRTQADGGATRKLPCRAGNPGAHGPLDPGGQPPCARRNPGQRVQAGPAWRRAAGAADDRRGPLQGLQRSLRPRAGRPVPAPGGPGAVSLRGAGGGNGGPLWRRRVCRLAAAHNAGTGCGTGRARTPFHQRTGIGPRLRAQWSACDGEHWRGLP